MTSLTILNTVLAQTVQAVSDTIAAANNVVAASGQQIEQTTNELSVWSLCLKGGFIMIPLAVLALLSIYVLVERYLAIKAAAKEDDTFMKRIRDYIHVEDLAQAHWQAVQKLDDYSGYLNLGTGVGTSVMEIIKAAEKVSGLPCPVTIAPRREGDPAKLFADNKKAKQILNWTPVYTSVEDIVKTAWVWENNRRFGCQVFVNAL